MLQAPKMPLGLLLHLSFDIPSLFLFSIMGVRDNRGDELRLQAGGESLVCSTIPCFIKENNATFTLLLLIPILSIKSFKVKDRSKFSSAANSFASFSFADSFESSSVSSTILFFFTHSSISKQQPLTVRLLRKKWRLRWDYLKCYCYTKPIIKEFCHLMVVIYLFSSVDTLIYEVANEIWQRFL